MADIGRVLFTAKEALLSNLTAINVTGSNIANVNTPGYSRLRPMFESVGTSDASSTQEQVGVRVGEIERIYDKFLEAEMVKQQSSLANYATQEDLLKRVEGILNENTGGGINDALGEFLNAWGNLSVDPSSKSKRDMVVSTGENLSYIFNQRAEELVNIQATANNSLADTVATLNRYLEQMANYNELIVSVESAGSSASSVRDKRGELLNDISKLIDINYMEKSDGSLYIYLPTNGKALVEGVNNWALDVVDTNSDNLFDIVFTEYPAQSINDQINGGKLAGLLEVRDNYVPSYLNQLNQTAGSIIDRVNTLHTNGYDQDGNPGELFFDFDPANAAKSMQVGITIAVDTRKIAASATMNADGDNATAMTAIKNEINASLGNVSIDGYFNAFIANMGQDVVNATQAVGRETTILNQQIEQREQVSGVSLDEEMMNLIKFQMAYGAAGRMTTTVNEMMDILMNLGR